MFSIMLMGCSAHQQLAADKPPVPQKSLQASASETPGVESGVATARSSVSEDPEGYKIRPVDIKIEGGRPYLPVGAEFTAKGGKVPLGKVIKAMADHKGLSVSWADDVDQQKLVDCYIKAADDFYDALDQLLGQLDYFYEIKGDTIVIRYKETKKYHLAMPDFEEGLDTSLGGNMLPDTEGDAGLDATATLEINSDKFKFWEDLKEGLGSIIDCADCPAPILDKTLGVITVTASRSVQEAVRRYLAEIEKAAYRQVVIEAKIIEVSLTEGHEQGVDWEGVFGGKTFSGTVELGDANGYWWQNGNGWNTFLNGITINDVTWDVIVAAFEKYGDTRILSNPKIHLLNGHSSVFSAGRVQSYLEGCNVTTSGESGATTEEPEIGSVTQGLSVGIKANILDDNKSVILYVFPAITRVIEMRDISSTRCGMVQAPETAVREMATYARVRDGEYLVIGGLISESNDKKTKKIPYLGDVPYLGKWLFSYESMQNTKTELVIILKPRILKNHLEVTAIE